MKSSNKRVSSLDLVTPPNVSITSRDFFPRPQDDTRRRSKRLREQHFVNTIGTETSTERSNPEHSRLDLLSVVPSSKNLARKLFRYIKKNEAIFKEAMKSSKEMVSSLGLVNPPNIPSTPSGFFQEPPKEILPFSQFAFQHSTPSTSRDVSQDQGDIEHRSKRFKKEKVDDAFQPIDSSEF
ncbi:hypothetical protein TNCT_270751 [Trichonephila clavata]|uniref:Uncharacterized protein n=1 Tax=Trichonephila clavata TaxID=2740835 RepID=A0A8X6JD13_TRICU|nr:hypothetical protein TNCT_270751 [Trichonephila clavata]